MPASVIQQGQRSAMPPSSVWLSSHAIPEYRHTQDEPSSRSRCPGWQHWKQRCRTGTKVFIQPRTPEHSGRELQGPRRSKDEQAESNAPKAQPFPGTTNAALPAIVHDLRRLLPPVQLTDAALVSWARQQLNIPQTHCYDAAIQSQDFNSVVSLPSTALVLRPNNGRSKQKANVDHRGTPVGRPFRQHHRLPKHLRHSSPAARHSNCRQRHGPQLIATGDTVRLSRRNRIHTNRTVIKDAGSRAAIQGTKPQVSANTEQCRRLAHNPRWVIRRAAPSQQQHESATLE